MEMIRAVGPNKGLTVFIWEKTNSIYQNKNCIYINSIF